MKRPMCFISIVLAAFIIFLLTLSPPSVYNDVTSSEQPIEVEGRVGSKYLKNNSFYLELFDAVSVAGGIPEGQKNNIIVKLAGDSRFADIRCLPEIGRICRIRGTKLLFMRSSNPGQFDMAFYEMQKGFDYQVCDSEITGTYGNKDILKETLCIFRWRLGNIYDRLLNEDDSGVVRSMILGDKTGLGDEIKGLYQRTGISHALCISGLHISLLGYGLYRLLKRLCMPRAPAGALSLAVMTLYGMMTGMGTSTLRALIMFGIVLTGEAAGRSYDILSSLSMACTVILLAKPLNIFDAGFMLSFAAVLGIGAAGPVLAKAFPLRSFLADSIKTSISVNLFTFPITLYFFYQFPVYSVIFNLILIPLMGVLLLAALITGAAGIVFLPAGKFPALACHLILSLYKGGCRINDELPFSLYVAGRPEAWKIIVYYILIFTALFLAAKSCRQDKYGKYMICTGVALTASAWMLLMAVPRPPLRLTMIDVGQGDSIFLQCRDGTDFLIDCGSSDVKEAAGYRVIPFLKSIGTGSIDYAVITHTDADHVNGFDEMLSESDAEGIRIKCLIMPAVSGEDEEYTRLRELAEAKGVSVRYISTGSSITCGRLKLNCLHPDSGTVFEDVNEGSAVLDLGYGNFSALLTGDIQGEGEEQMTRLLCHEYTLLKCAHHGSENSTPERFLEKVNPGLTFISCGEGNRYGHPHEALLERLEKTGTRIIITKDSGAITVRTDGEKLSIEKFR